MTKQFRSTPLFIAVALAMAVASARDASAQTPATIGPNLERFSVFGSGGVVGSAGAGTTVNGDVGGFATCTVTNFPPSNVVPPFVNHGPGPACDAVVGFADGEATVAFNSLNQGVGTVLPASLNLANGTGIITPGIYTFLGGAAILPATTTVTFNGPGIYVLRTASTLDVVNGLGTNMILAGGANACDIYWQVGSTATIEVPPAGQFVGQVFASASAIVTAGNVRGRIIALNAAATMSNGGNTIGGCAISAPVVPPPVPALPTAAGFGLLAALLATGAVVLSRR
jgi:Ice-binding-like